MVNHILNWAEVWGLLIPLIVILLKKENYLQLAPVKYYVFVAVGIYLVIDIISNQRSLKLHLPWHQNGLLYNLQAIIQFICFSWFFLSLQPSFFQPLKKGFVAVFILFLPFHFLTFPFTQLSSLLHGLEVGLLLIFCLLYYFEIMIQEQDINFEKKPEFWIVTGLSAYIVVSFFILLFYNKITKDDTLFAIGIWSWHNISFVMMCLLIAKGFYQSYMNSKKFALIDTVH
ncbi:MAG: hypothetical protein LH478_05340 [Chitinophagaceae bacterium]|nr:hypothetical protein [Chitinophagaceae bacterium]